jgi:anti-anti-sigma factor
VIHEPVEIVLDDTDEATGRLAKVRGVLDVFTSPTLATRALANLPDQTRSIMIDLRDVSFVDSAGISALVRLRQEATHRALDVHAHLGNARERINATVVDVVRRVLPCDD